MHAGNQEAIHGQCLQQPVGLAECIEAAHLWTSSMMLSCLLCQPDIMVARQQYCGLQMTCQTILNLTNQILDMTSNLLSCSNSKFSAVHSDYLVAPDRIGEKVWQNIMAVRQEFNRPQPCRWDVNYHSTTGQAQLVLDTCLLPCLSIPAAALQTHVDTMFHWFSGWERVLAPLTRPGKS